MMLADGQILALAVPIAATIVAGAMARLTYSSVMRGRRLHNATRIHAPSTQDGERLVEIDPDALLSAPGDGQPRYFLRATSLRALLARANL